MSIENESVVRHAPVAGSWRSGRGNEIAIDSTGIRHAPARPAWDDAPERSRWVHLAETSRIDGWSNPPLQLTNAPTIFE
jgi:hypothetical protein